jgi:putative flippase GtrA
VNRIKEIWNRHRDILLYLFFGGLTTLVNFIIYLPLYHLCALPASISNIIAWIGAVIFAFLTNKPFVFHSNDWSMHVVVPEFTKFVGCRVGSGIFETIIIWLTVDILAFNGNLVKILVSVMVVILNYIASKWIVFSKKQ